MPLQTHLVHSASHTPVQDGFLRAVNGSKVHPEKAE